MGKNDNYDVLDLANSPKSLSSAAFVKTEMIKDEI